MVVRIRRRQGIIDAIIERVPSAFFLPGNAKAANSAPGRRQTSGERPVNTGGSPDFGKPLHSGSPKSQNSLIDLVQ